MYSPTQCHPSGVCACSLMNTPPSTSTAPPSTPTDPPSTPTAPPSTPTAPPSTPTTPPSTPPTPKFISESSYLYELQIISTNSLLFMMQNQACLV